MLTQTTFLLLAFTMPNNATLAAPDFTPKATPNFAIAIPAPPVMTEPPVTPEPPANADTSIPPNEFGEWEVMQDGTVCIDGECFAPMMSPSGEVVMMSSGNAFMQRDAPFMSRGPARRMIANRPRILQRIFQNRPRLFRGRGCN